MRQAPLTHEIVLAAQQSPLPHPDSADRFLAATARVWAAFFIQRGRHGQFLGPPGRCSSLASERDERHPSPSVKLVQDQRFNALYPLKNRVVGNQASGPGVHRGGGLQGIWGS